MNHPRQSLGQSHRGLFRPSKDAELVFEADVGDFADQTNSAERWGRVLEEQYYALSFASQGAELEVGNLQVADVGPMRLGFVECDPYRVLRQRSHLSQDSEEFIMIPLASRSDISLEQFGRSTRLASGDLGFVMTGSPYLFDQHERDRIIALRLPAKLVRSQIPIMDDLAARSIDGASTMVPIFIDFLHSCTNRGELSELEKEGVLRCLVDLLAMCVYSPNGGHNSEETSVMAAHRRRTMSFIENNLSDFDLSSSKVAQGVGISPRYLQKVFSTTGDRVVPMIRSMRIAQAKRQLRNPALKHLSIAQIAYAAGFRNVTSFNKAFRAEVDETPTEFRQNCLIVNTEAANA